MHVSGYQFFTVIQLKAENAINSKEHMMSVTPQVGPAGIPGKPAGSVQHPDGAEISDARLREVAEQLEASFLSEMLKAAGLGKPRSDFGGGTGEDQFSSFLRDAQAQEMVKRGGIGLAQNLFEALKERSGDN